VIADEHSHQSQPKNHNSNPEQVCTQKRLIMSTRTARELMVGSTSIKADHDANALDRTADQRLLLLQCRVGACACETASQLVGEIEGG